MKKYLIVVFLLFLLFLFTSCERNPSLEEKYDSLLEEKSYYEDKYHSAYEGLSNFNFALNDIYDSFIVIREYYHENSPDYSESDALSAIEKIDSIYADLGV